MDEKPNNIEDIDVNSPEFYENVQNEIESDMARMKKSVEVLMNLRSGPIVIRSGSDDGILEKWKELFKYYRHTYNDLVEAAEIEVETAALFHAELFYDMLVIHDNSHDNSGDEECEKAEENTQKT